MSAVVGSRWPSRYLTGCTCTVEPYPYRGHPVTEVRQVDGCPEHTPWLDGIGQTAVDAQVCVLRLLPDGEYPLQIGKRNAGPDAVRDRVAAGEAQPGAALREAAPVDRAEHAPFQSLFGPRTLSRIQDAGASGVRCGVYPSDPMVRTSAYISRVVPAVPVA